tara:strand:+ start:227 stop:334 length:108 start_codon:yes stop_codon:yes gene_type:complete
VIQEQFMVKVTQGRFLVEGDPGTKVVVLSSGWIEI